MKEFSIEELKTLQLDILLEVDNFCRSNNIQYSLGYGTLIGAIRHKGYIPWDDDIDIIMTRSNYDKFIRSFNSSSKRLYVISPELNWNYYATYANVCDSRTILDEGANGHNGVEVGVKIDIFPMDYIPQNQVDELNVRSKIKFLNSLLEAKRYKLYNFGWKTKILFLINRVISIFRTYASIQKQIHELATSFNDGDYVDNLVFYPKPLQTPVKYFDEYIDVDFEGYKLKSIKEYDAYLRQIYGDYMQLPPLEQQVPRHGFTAYWKA